MSRILRRWFAPIIVNLNLPESIIMAAIDDLKAAANTIVANQATLVAENTSLTAQVADLTAKLAAAGDATTALATEDAAVADVAAQLNAAVVPAPAPAPVPAA